MAAFCSPTDYRAFDCDAEFTAEHGYTAAFAASAKQANPVVLAALKKYLCADHSSGRISYELMHLVAQVEYLVDSARTTQWHTLDFKHLSRIDAGTTSASRQYLRKMACYQDGVAERKEGDKVVQHKIDGQNFEQVRDLAPFDGRLVHGLMDLVGVATRTHNPTPSTSSTTEWIDYDEIAATIGGTAKSGRLPKPPELSPAFIVRLVTAVRSGTATATALVFSDEVELQPGQQGWNSMAHCLGLTDPAAKRLASKHTYGYSCPPLCEDYPYYDLKSSHGAGNRTIIPDLATATSAQHADAFRAWLLTFEACCRELGYSNGKHWKALMAAITTLTRKTPSAALARQAFTAAQNELHRLCADQEVAVGAGADLLDTGDLYLQLATYVCNQHQMIQFSGSSTPVKPVIDPSAASPASGGKDRVVDSEYAATTTHSTAHSRPRAALTRSRPLSTPRSPRAHTHAVSTRLSRPPRRARST